MILMLYVVLWDKFYNAVNIITFPESCSYPRLFLEVRGLLSCEVVINLLTSQQSAPLMAHSCHLLETS